MKTFEEWKLEQLSLGNLKLSTHGLCKDSYVGKWKRKYTNKKMNAKVNNRIFTLTFDKYLYKCFEAGLTCPTKIGQKIDNYQLSRYKDKGEYTIDNCRFITKLENQRERDEHFNCSENALKCNSIKVKNGTHHYLNIKPWNHPNCTINSLEVWSKAQECYKWWLKTNKGCGYLLKEFNFKSQIACKNIINKFKSGWIPTKDKNWLKFYNEV